MTPRELLAKKRAEEKAQAGAQSPEDGANGEEVKAAPEIIIIYDASSKDFYVPSPKGGYHNLNVEGLRRYLKIMHGLDARAGKDEDASEVDQAICQAENFNRVDFVGKYAGYREAKIYTVVGGYQLLVPAVQKRREPIQGKWDHIRGFLEGIFTNLLELKVFYGWLQNCWKSSLCEPGEWWPQQALVLIGIPDSGKTAIQKTIITPLLGREEDPVAVFIGASSFNAHLAEAEHWMLSDPKWTTRAEKESFATAFKDAVANSSTPVHPKGKQQRKLEIFKRVTLSLNDEDEPMSIFPLMPPSTLEKLIFLRTDGISEYTPKGGEDWAIWKRKVESELPAFLWYLLNEFEIPEEIRHKRYGVTYRNESIYNRISAPTAEEKDADVDEILLEAIFLKSATEKMDESLDERLNRESTKKPKTVVMTTTGVHPKVFAFDFSLLTAARKALPDGTTLLRKRLERMCTENKGIRNGYKIEIARAKNPTKFRFTELP